MAFFCRFFRPGGAADCSGGGPFFRRNGGSARCAGPRHAGEYLHQRPAHQTRQRSAGRSGRHRGPRDGGSRGGGRERRVDGPSGRPRDGQRGDFLRGVLLLPARLREQLHGSAGRLGSGMPHRRRTGRIRAGSARRSGAEPHPGGGERATSRRSSWATFWRRGSGRRGSPRSRRRTRC